MDKRIDAIAMAMQFNGSVYDLEEAELCYAPQFGSAKSPVNFAGMVASDVLRDDMPLCHWDSLDERVPPGCADPAGTCGGARPRRDQHPAAGSCARRLAELPRNREIHVFCRSGQRAYYATRILLQNGFDARNISGGMLARLNAGR